MNGIEEVPFPKGAIQFKLDGIAQSLLIFFIFTIPLIIFNKPKKTHSISERVETNINLDPFHPIINESIDNNNEEWEEATIEDIESGKYEPI